MRTTKGLFFFFLFTKLSNLFTRSKNVSKNSRRLSTRVFREKYIISRFLTIISITQMIYTQKHYFSFSKSLFTSSSVIFNRIAASFMVIIVALMVLFIFMLRLKCAVLETGIIVPYKFIDWSHLFDYSVNKDMNTIFFCGNKQGFDTVFAATTRLEFADEDLDALIAILNNHKLNK